MKRLTFDGLFCDIAKCDETPSGTFCETGSCTQRKVWERLKEYEDTGLEPEQIKSAQETLRCFDNIGIRRGNEIVSAEQDGRLVVLPCKVGDVVYGFHQERTILPMVAKWIETNTDGWTVAAQYVPMAPKFYLFSDFGKTVFLTRKEAEAALAGKGGEEHRENRPD